MPGPIQCVDAMLPAGGMDSQKVFLSHLDLIERIIRSISRRNALSREDEEEFGSWVKVRLIDDDYATIRKFEGRSSFLTYLTIVMINLFRDYRNQRWGRWRPSAEAKRLGEVAMHMEKLLYRDGCSRNEAIQVIHSTSRDVVPTTRELNEIAAKLTPRVQAREIGAQSLLRMPSGASADSDVIAAEELSDQESANAAIAAAIRTLHAEDQIIYRMLFWDNVSVADVARALNLPQKPLYRRIDKLHRRIRRILESRGIDRSRVSSLLAAEGAG
jgi:RNA polymerase sigma factor (sigma-70 family)